MVEEDQITENSELFLTDSFFSVKVKINWIAFYMADTLHTWMRAKSSCAEKHRCRNIPCPIVRAQNSVPKRPCQVVRAEFSVPNCPCRIVRAELSRAEMSGAEMSANPFRRAASYNKTGVYPKIDLTWDYQNN